MPQQRISSTAWHFRCSFDIGEATMAERKDNDRELIDTGDDKRYVRRDADGQFKESDDVGRSLSQDRGTDAETETRKGQGDRGDRAK